MLALPQPGLHLLCHFHVYGKHWNIRRLVYFPMAPSIYSSTYLLLVSCCLEWLPHAPPSKCSMPLYISSRTQENLSQSETMSENEFHNVNVNSNSMLAYGLQWWSHFRERLHTAKDHIHTEKFNRSSRHRYQNRKHKTALKWWNDNYARRIGPMSVLYS